MPANESNYEREITRRIILDTEQIRVNGQVKSFAEIWLGDKKLLERQEITYPSNYQWS